MRRVLFLSSALLISATSAFGQGAAETLDRARDLYAQGKLDDAVAMFTDLVGAADHVVAAIAADELLSLGRFERLERAARDFMRRTPNSSERWGVLGRALRAQGKADEADDAFARAVQGSASDQLVARFDLAVGLYDRGEHAEASSQFDSFIARYNELRNRPSRDLAAIAAAAVYLGSGNAELVQDAVRVFDEAISADPRNVAARVAQGQLFLDKSNNTDASAVFREALQRNPNHPDALLGLAKSLHFDGAGEAREMVDRALELNPNSVNAHVFLAEMLIETESYETATEEANRALAVDPQSLNALSVLAAAQYMAGERDAFSRTESRILTRNPRYTELYETLAELSARNRLYREAADFARRGVTLDSGAYRAYGLLGMNQLRLGEIDSGRANLERSFQANPFDVQIKNTLDLTDTFEAYRLDRGTRFHFMIDSGEVGAITPYMAALAEEAFQALSRRYQYQPPTPVRFEVYPRSADFSVRTIGLTGLGALGVSFGSVIAMESPSARPGGQFNWGTTLWHEMAHTFHLGMTNHRVPRWFSEGLAVHEERQARQGWGGDVTPSFLRSYQNGNLPPVSNLNAGFVRPQYPEQVVHSYYLASLVFEFIEDRWGFAAIRQMLHGFRDGLTTDAVFESVLKTDIRAFDEIFDKHLRDRFTAAMVAVGSEGAEPPANTADAVRRASDRNSFPAQLTAGILLYDAGRVDDAVPYLERARELFPQYAGAGSPYWYLGKILAARGDFEAAERSLATLVSINENSYEGLLELASVREQLGNNSGAAEALANAQYVNPFDIATHRRLAELYGALDNWNGAVTEREAIVGLRPVDMAEARYHLAVALFRAERPQDARREILLALQLAPQYDDALDLLLDIRAAIERGGR